jgi:peptidyl-prolyl cis-trans isomerase B (cyclophilin B)
MTQPKPPIAQFIALIILTGVLIIGAQAYAKKRAEVPTVKTIATISTDKGDIKIELFPDDAPKTVNNFVKLSQKGYYDGVIFHRVIQDFMIQTGDPTGTGSGGQSIYGGDFADEINSHKIVPGTVAMANRGPNTNGSQFFIVTEKAQPSLDGSYTAFGQVIDGMDTVKAIAAVEVDHANGDKPKQDIKIKSVKIEEVTATPTPAATSTPASTPQP